MLSFFWRYVHFLYFICFIFFFFTFCFTCWSKFISYYISNQIICSFCGFLNYSFRRSFCSIFSCFYCSIYYLFVVLITRFSWQWQKAPAFNIFFNFWFCWISHFYNVYPIISVILILSSISRGLLFCSGNHASVEGYSVFAVFSIVNEWGAMVTNCPNRLFGTKVTIL